MYLLLPHWLGVKLCRTEEGPLGPGATRNLQVAEQERWEKRGRSTPLTSPHKARSQFAGCCHAGLLNNGIASYSQCLLDEQQLGKPAVQKRRPIQVLG